MDIRQIPIISYHKVEPQSDIGITARNPVDFEKDIEALTVHGYQFVCLKDSQHLPPQITKPVILTFDDGYDSVFQYARPVLKKFHATATIFIPAHFIGKTNSWDVQMADKKYRHLDDRQLRELHHLGYEIGAHGLTHQSFCGMKQELLRRELIESKRILQDITGEEVVSLCYPFRRFNQSVIKMAEQAGYRYGIGSQRLNMANHHSLALPRIDVYRFDSTNRLLRSVENFNRFRLRDKIIQMGAFATIAMQKLSTNSR